jgi:hypothetical protein
MDHEEFTPEQRQFGRWLGAVGTSSAALAWELTSGLKLEGAAHMAVAALIATIGTVVFAVIYRKRQTAKQNSQD